jgi:hypothetical protein
MGSRVHQEVQGFIKERFRVQEVQGFKGFNEHEPL